MSALPRPRFEGGTGYLLAIAGATARRQWVEMLGQYDVTPSQFKVIMALSEVAPVGQRQLAEMVSIDPRNCAPVIDSLVERNLLSREVDGTDRRRRLLRLTGRGRQLARELESVNTRIEATLLSPLSSTQQAALHRVLTTIVEAAQPDA